MELAKRVYTLIRQISRGTDIVFNLLRERATIITYAAVLYLIGTTNNLQIQAFFTESADSHDRIIAAIGASVTATTHFAIRRSLKSGLILWIDIALHLLPTLVIIFLPPWGGQLSWVLAVIPVLQIFIMMPLVASSMVGRTKTSDSLLVIVFGVVIVSYFVFSNFRVELPRHLGTVVLVALFLGVVSMLVYIISGYRILSGLALSLLVGSLLFHEFVHNAQYRTIQVPAKYEWDNPFALWLFDRPDADHYRKIRMPYPVFLIASEGGGGYAKAHAYTFLSKMSERCPNFSQHLFALVGVSGGQIGNTLFHANNVTSQSANVDPCGKSARTSYSSYLSIDHLSPLVAHLLFVEIPRKIFFLGAAEPGRSHVLLESFNSSEEGYKPIPDYAYENHFWRSIPTDDGFGFVLHDKPALVSVSVNVQTGNRFIFSPFYFTTRGEMYVSSNRIVESDPLNGLLRSVPSLGSVSVASASFPWVTPSLRFDLNNRGQNMAVNLVDGGYFENTGVETLSEIVASLESRQQHAKIIRDSKTNAWYGPYGERSLRSFKTLKECDELKGRPVKHFDFPTEWASCEVPYFIVNVLIRNVAEPAKSGRAQSFLLDPVTTLLQSRSARGGLAVSTLLERRCGFGNVSNDCSSVNHITKKPFGIPHDGVYQSFVDSNAMNLPLGWAIPENRIRAIENMVVPDEEICAQFADRSGRIDFSVPHTDTSLHLPELDDLVKYNCANQYFLSLFFDPGKYMQDLFLRVN